MGQFQGSFKRYEKKYLINEMQYGLLRLGFRDRLKADAYGKMIICNVYFDTPDFRLIRESLEGPVYKEKLRLRSYGTPQDNDAVYVELKKKYQGIVYKRREQLELPTAEHYLYDSEPIGRKSQVINEIDWFKSFYKELIPAMYISYNRIAMSGSQDAELRVTFDDNILWREEELWLECGVWGKPLLKDGWSLMEVKLQGAIPLWLSKLFDALEIYPTSFSKYGRGYEQLILQKKSETNKGEIIYA